jgi:1-acyl-sn-glycerol-3-phosphate acyltransferase
LRVLFYRILHVIILILAKVIFRLKVIGHSNIPKKGGVIIAANHASYLDPPLIACAILRKVNFMAMAELFKNPFCGTLYKILGAFPVKREEADAGAIRRAVKLLKQGKLLLMFPEGTRSYDGRLQEPKGGVGMIAALSKAKVVPTFIKGTEKALPRGTWRLGASPVTVSFGEPLELPELETSSGSKERKEYYNNINIKIMEEIAKIQSTVNRESK